MKHKLSTYTIPVSTLLLALLLVATTPSLAQNNSNNDSNIAGTWNGLWSSTDGGPQFVFMIQFGSEGTITTIETDAFATSAGAWQRVDGRTYAFNIYEYAFSALGQPYQGTFKTLAQVKLTPNGEKFSGTYHLDFYDTNGVLQFSDDGTITGSRVHVQMMP